MAYLREVVLELDPFKPSICYLRIPVKQYNAFIERVYTRKSEFESATPVAVIRDTGIPEMSITNDGITWDTEFFLTLVCLRKKGENVELPSDAGRLLGVVSEPTASWYLCVQRTPQQEPQPEPKSETREPGRQAAPEYD